jgi:hypothetical protein
MMTRSAPLHRLQAKTHRSLPESNARGRPAQLRQAAFAGWDNRTDPSDRLVQSAANLILALQRDEDALRRLRNLGTTLTATTNVATPGLTTATGAKVSAVAIGLNARNQPELLAYVGADQPVSWVSSCTLPFKHSRGLVGASTVAAGLINKTAMALT